MYSVNKFTHSLSRLPMPGESDSTAIATSCCNLRRRRDSNDLCPVGAPKAQAALHSVPFAIVGNLHFYDRSGMVYVYNSATSGTMALGALPGRFRCAAVISPSRIEVMTARGHVTIAIDPSGTPAFLNPPSRLPLLRFSIVDELNYTAGVSGRTLNGSYDARSTSFNNADAANLASDLLASYERLDRSARSGGYFIQPVMLRYKLYGADDELLYTSNSCVISPEGGFQCMRSFSALLDDNGTRRLSSAIEARGAKIQLTLHDSYNPDSTVERLVVEAALPAHPVDFSDTAATRLGSALNTNNGVQVDFCLPGCSVGMASSSFNGISRLKDIADHPDQAFTTVATRLMPFGTGEPITIDIPTPELRLSVKKQLTKIATLADKHTSRLPHPLPHCLAPHRFSASTCATAGDLVLWGNIEVHPFEGYSLNQFAIDVCTDDWEGAAIVKMADGSIAVSATHDEGDAPYRFSQMLTYPSPHAREITLAIRRRQQCYAATFPLTPSADNSCAYYIADDCIELPPVQSLDIPFDTRQSTAFPNFTVAALRKSPVNPISLTSSTCPVTALAAIDRRGGAWEYAKNRVYIFGSSGTTIANINSSGEWTSAHLFDTRPVESARNVCVTTDDIYPVIAVAGNDLVGFRNNTLQTLQCGVQGAEIAWDPVDRELWMRNCLGEVEIHTTPGGARYTLADWCALELGGFNNTLIVRDENGVIHSTAAGRASANIPVIYSVAIESPDLSTAKSPAMRRLAGFSLGLRTDGGSGKVIISADDTPVCTLDFNGPVERCIGANVITFSAYTLTLNFTATLTHRSHLHNLLLKFPGSGK